MNEERTVIRFAQFTDAPVVEIVHRYGETIANVYTHWYSQMSCHKFDIRLIENRTFENVDNVRFYNF